MTLAKLTIVSISLLFSFLGYQISAADDHAKIQYQTDRETIIYLAKNGRVWKLMTRQIKSFYLIGIEEGTNLLMLQMNDGNLYKIYLHIALKEQQKLQISGFQFGDLVDQIDIVYSDSANLNIPIIEAYRHILKKLRGATPSALANDLAMLRKTYNN